MLSVLDELADIQHELTRIQEREIFRNRERQTCSTVERPLSKYPLRASSRAGLCTEISPKLPVFADDDTHVWDKAGAY